MEDLPDYELDFDKQILPCIEKINENMKKNSKTLVICTAGISRSATVCISYLIKY